MVNLVKKCPTCLKDFEVWPCKRWRKYCSRECSLGLQGKKKPPFVWLFNKVRYVAKMRGRDFGLSFDDFLGFTKIANCHYCGSPIEWSPHAPRSTRGYFLDRKDSSRGYEKENCVVCCSRCNWAKSDSFSYAEWIEIGKAIKRFGKKNNERALSIQPEQGFDVPKRRMEVPLL